MRAPLGLSLACMLLAGCTMSGSPSESTAISGHATVNVVNQESDEHPVTVVTSVNGQVVDQVTQVVAPNATVSIQVGIPAAGNVQFAVHRDMDGPHTESTFAVGSCKQLTLSYLLRDGNVASRDQKCT